MLCQTPPVIAFENRPDQDWQIIEPQNRSVVIVFAAVEHRVTARWLTVGAWWCQMDLGPVVTRSSGEIIGVLGDDAVVGAFHGHQSMLQLVQHDNDALDD